MMISVRSAGLLAAVVAATLANASQAAETVLVREMGLRTQQASFYQSWTPQKTISGEYRAVSAMAGELAISRRRHFFEGKAVQKLNTIIGDGPAVLEFPLTPQFSALGVRDRTQPIVIIVGLADERWLMDAEIPLKYWDQVWDGNELVEVPRTRTVKLSALSLMAEDRIYHQPLETVGMVMPDSYGEMTAMSVVGFLGRKLVAVSSFEVGQLARGDQSGFWSFVFPLRQIRWTKSAKFRRKSPVNNPLFYRRRFMRLDEFSVRTDTGIERFDPREHSVQQQVFQQLPGIRLPLTGEELRDAVYASIVDADHEVPQAKSFLGRCREWFAHPESILGQ